jgi:hypothetical protein
MKQRAKKVTSASSSAAKAAKKKTGSREAGTKKDRYASV